MHKITAIILDWAGTAIDYGCFAPVNAFITAFETFGIYPNIEEIRAPMGLPKRAHIEKILEGRGISAQWQNIYGRSYTQADVNNIYGRFETALFEVLALHTDPLPGTVKAVASIRDMGMAIGSTTGYTRAMMNEVVPLVKKKGYAPDCVICPDDTRGAGRPYPYMLWRNLEKLGVSSIDKVLKAGDTAADMREGKNAGCLCVGILKGSSMLGLSEEEMALKTDTEISALFETARKNFTEAGADYVIEDIGGLPGLIESLQ
ncbi:MAG: phosphonoacetaldehyde hydrolase [Treponema sp.]|jgi:phosphonoacetaldehyde hydrolase|nr:phosphonoacetaldehyde hydrolase [Treponema sp.]